jgi:hypothetical protein
MRNSACQLGHQVAHSRVAGIIPSRPDPRQTLAVCVAGTVGPAQLEARSLIIGNPGPGKGHVIQHGEHLRRRCGPDTGNRSRRRIRGNRLARVTPRHEPGNEHAGSAEYQNDGKDPGQSGSSFPCTIAGLSRSRLKLFTERSNG